MRNSGSRAPPAAPHSRAGSLRSPSCRDAGPRPHPACGGPSSVLLGERGPTPHSTAPCRESQDTRGKPNRKGLRGPKPGPTLRGLARGGHTRSPGQHGGERQLAPCSRSAGSGLREGAPERPRGHLRRRSFSPQMRSKEASERTHRLVHAHARRHRRTHTAGCTAQAPVAL